MDALITTKIVKITTHGDAQTDVEVEMSMDGKSLGTTTVRVNRSGKEAEDIATAQARLQAATMALPEARPQAPAAPAPKAPVKSKPPIKE